MAEPDNKYCFDLVMNNAKEFYYADLLLPKLLRPEIVVLHAFHIEISNAILASSEPMVGEVRLQWWADVVAGRRNDEAKGHPVAGALIHLITKHDISRAALDAKLEAHIFDLYNDPMGDRSMLEGYLGETRSMLFQMAAMIAGAELNTAVANAAGHAGVAVGIVSCLENMALHRNKRKIYIPSDLLAACGLNAQEFLGQSNAKHEQAVLGFVNLAREHYTKAMSFLELLPSDVRIVFKPLAVAPYYLKRAEKNPKNVLTGLPLPSQIKRQWAIWRF